MNLLHALFTRNLLMSGVAIVRCIPRAFRVKRVDGNLFFTEEKRQEFSCPSHTGVTGSKPVAPTIPSCRHSKGASGGCMLMWISELISCAEIAQWTRMTTTVASSVWHPLENSSMDAKIPSAMSSTPSAPLSAAAWRSPSTCHSSPLGLSASTTPSV
jgi:hypothetical protein